MPRITHFLRYSILMASISAESIIAELQKRLTDGSTDYHSIFRLSNELSKFDTKHQRFSVDAKTLIHLGRDSIKDHTTALIELVKNSYDADAKKVDVEIYCKDGKDLIRVSDNGFGMTKDELMNSWLRIGFSNKRKSKQSQSGRRRTGEKGIGRISTDRLGANLELISKTIKDGIIGLKVNWDEFDTDGKDVFDIEVELTDPKEIVLPASLGKEVATGTEIKITRLRQIWSEENIENLYYELSSLTAPFEEVNDFKINLQNDVSPVFSTKIGSGYLAAAEIELTAIFDGSNEVYYEIKDKYHNNSEIQTISLKQFLDRTKSGKDSLICGPIQVRLLFFLRVGASVRDSTFSLGDLTDFLDNNAGIKIYRDKISVKPYGFPKAQLGYDWLGIGERKAKDPAGVGRPTYKVSPNQLVGAVFITRDENTLLSDSAAREGLVESEAFYDMKAFALASLNLLESHRSSLYEATEKNSNKSKGTGRQEVEHITRKLRVIKDDLTLIKSDIETKGDQLKTHTLIKPIQKTISEVESVSGEVNTAFSDILNWQRVLSGLATMGISSAVFGHETESSIVQFKSSATEARDALNDTPPNIKSALQELDKAIKHSKKVAAWGAYALTRVQREKRTKKNIQIIKSIQAVVNELEPAFEASSIKIEVLGDIFYSKTYSMDIESMLVNLLTNAYTACSLTSGRKVRIRVSRKDKKDREGFSIAVSDSGPGVAKQFVNRIFEPLFSTKTSGVNSSKSVGTGLGLTIVKSVVDDLKGEITVDTDPILKGARFQIWLPKE
jgi:signal transduction histidine kinase